jgi:hypothetical protein
MTVAMTPSEQNVAPGAGFDVDFSVVAADSLFNGYNVVVSYDPSAVTFVPTSPTSLQQGCLMTGACSAACGNTFHVFNAAADSLSIHDVLLCAGVALQGPGQLYTLHFVASNTPQVTWVRIRGFHFYNKGYYVLGIDSQDAAIGIGVTLGVPGGAHPPGVPRVSCAPNPARGTASILVETSAGGDEELLVSDVAGRAVRQLQRGAFSQGTRTVTWDGRDDLGRSVPPGVYLVRLRSGGRSFHTRLAWLQ